MFVLEVLFTDKIQAAPAATATAAAAKGKKAKAAKAAKGKANGAAGKLTHSDLNPIGSLVL